MRASHLAYALLLILLSSATPSIAQQTVLLGKHSVVRASNGVLDPEKQKQDHWLGKEISNRYGAQLTELKIQRVEITVGKVLTNIRICSYYAGGTSRCIPRTLEKPLPLSVGSNVIRITPSMDGGGWSVTTDQVASAKISYKLMTETLESSVQFFLSETYWVH
jgi:hypothetical protein